MDAPTLFNLLTGWPIEPASMLAPLAGGTNNQAWSVQTEDGSSYVLRLTASVADLARSRYELALLTALRETSLPFDLPLPLQARSGESFLLVEQDNAEPSIATLTPFLPGCIPERTASNIARAGVALAQLDAALAIIPASSLPASSGATSFLYGDLSHCHPLVSNPLATVEHLLEPDQARSICALLLQTQQDWETLSTQNLPQQLLHRDCGPGNVLMEQQRVTAILDFEFAGVDRRIFDLCVAISWWPVRLMGTGQEWQLIDAFGQAYTASFPLTEEELLTLPATLRMRDTTSLIYRMGRYLAGLESAQTIQERVRHSLWREAWLMANRETLVQHVMAWRKGE
jgi:homoserine kinase type II